MKISKCARCGYEWETGKNGSHDCFDGIQAKLKRVIEIQDDKAEEIFKASIFCRDHNFNLEADSLFQKYTEVRGVLRTIRMTVLDNLLAVE